MVGRLFQNWWWPHCARCGLHRAITVIHHVITLIHCTINCTHRAMNCKHCAVTALLHARQCRITAVTSRDNWVHRVMNCTHRLKTAVTSRDITGFHRAMNCTHHVKTPVTSLDNWVSSRKNVLIARQLSNGVHFVYNTLSAKVIMVTCLLCHAHWFACAIHRQNCVHGLPKLLVVYWLELSIVARIRFRARDRERISDCFFSSLS